MTTVSATNSLTATTASTAANSASKLGISDFLTLLTSQMKYQDPNDPQKASEFVAQLAQFSSVTGIQEMNTSMSSLLSELRGSQALSATSLVGHDVLLTASKSSIGAGDQVSGAVETPSGATNLQVVVTDSSGQIVRQMSVATESPLSHFTWDGLDDSGNAVPADSYGFSALATVSGKIQSASTLLASKVASVTIDPSTNALTLNTTGLGSVDMSSVRQIM